MSNREAVEKALKLIEKEQKNLPKHSPARMVGMQLREIILREPEPWDTYSPSSAQLVAQDLEGKGMGLTDCEKKIKAWADAHRKGGNVVAVPPDVGEDIIREFYGLKPRGEINKNDMAKMNSPSLHLNVTNMDRSKADEAGTENRPRRLSLRLADFL